MTQHVGIVGHEAAKFTPETEAKAREIIRFLLDEPGTRLVSGHCHLGGVDIWAEEIADQLGNPTAIFRPTRLQWSGPGGYKERNQQIAMVSDIVHCVVVRKLPVTYTGMTFKECYHCKGRVEPHAKSGGCWTAWRCPNHQWWVL